MSPRAQSRGLAANQGRLPFPARCLDYAGAALDMTMHTMWTLWQIHNPRTRYERTCFAWCKPAPAKAICHPERSRGV